MCLRKINEKKKVAKIKEKRHYKKQLHSKILKTTNIVYSIKDEQINLNIW